MNIEDILRNRIEEKLETTEYQIMNESHLHAGHAGSPGTGHSHFQIHIQSPLFQGKSRVESQRIVYDLFDDLLKKDIHAMSLKLSAPKIEA